MQMSSGDSSSEADIEGISVSANGTGGTSKVRGKGTCTWMKDNKKESLEFDERCCSVGPNDANFARYLGGLARDHNALPLVHEHWPKVPNRTKTILWGKIESTIEWKPEDLPRIPLIKHIIMERVAKYWRSHKNRLKTLYYDTKIGTPGRWVCEDKDVDAGAWREMVKHWDKERTTEIAEKNSTNRKEQKYNHTSGTKSYARSRAEYLKKHGHEPDPIQFFYDKHTRKDDRKSWIDEVSERTHADMQKKLAELVAEEGEETTELRQRAYVSVMGPEKRYRVRGYGLGVMPEMVPYVQTESTSSSHRSHGKHYACLLSQFMELESKYKQQQEQAQVQQVRTQEQLLETQRELAMIKQMLQSQQSAPSSQQSSQFSQQPSFQLPSYPPQMYWPQPQMYPQMPYQPQPAYPTTSLTGLLMGDASVQEAELLNQLRASSNQSSHVSVG